MSRSDGVVAWRYNKWGDHRLPARNTPQSTLLTVPLNGSLVKVSEYQKASLRRGVTIVTEWWQSEIRRGNHRLPEQVWWHTKNTKGDTKFMNILFVCTGNTCRSAMAAAIMDKIAVENDLDVFIESAGIFAEDGQGASENAIKALMKYGIDLSGHRTQPVTEDLIKQCDLILTMTEGHKQILEPLAKGKVYIT